MAFQEKGAWVMLIGLIIGGANYFTWVGLLSREIGQLAPPILPMLVVFIVFLVVLAVIGFTIIALASPNEANAPADERDRRITERAGHWSGFVIGFGVIVSLGLYLFTYSGNLLFYGVFASLLLSSIVEYGSKVVQYRIG
ncbi:MAG: hypothetical protein AAGH65_00445 [Pseudomonadota bacterium]